MSVDGNIRTCRCVLTELPIGAMHADILGGELLPTDAVNPSQAIAEEPSPCVAVPRVADGTTIDKIAGEFQHPRLLCLVLHKVTLPYGLTKIGWPCMRV